VHAPAWARTRRRLLVPLLAAVALASFVALPLLPAFEHSLVGYATVMIVGTVSLAGLMLLLNGEPLPAPDYREVVLEQSDVVAFTIRQDPDRSALARREFWWRSVRELRLGTLCVGPAATLFWAALSYKASGMSLPTIGFLGFAVLGIVMFATFPSLIARSGAELARQFPEQHIRVSPQGIAVGTSEELRGLAWSNFARRWESVETVTLVMTPFTVLQLPKRDLPEAALRIISEGVPGG